MSRIGKKPISLPDGVTVEVQSPRTVIVRGSKGSLEFHYHREVNVIVDDQRKEILVEKVGPSKKAPALWGTTARLIENMIEGVVKGFEKKLELNGVGYRMSVSGKKMTLALGFSHPVEVAVPEDIEVKIEQNVCTVSGIDKHHVGQFAANIRALKPVEPYKGKGFKYTDEIVRRKEGKKAGTTK